MHHGINRGKKGNPVLLIGDRLQERNEIRMVLEALGACPISVEKMDEGIDEIYRSSPAMVFIDCRGNKIAPDLCRQIKHGGMYADLPVICFFAPNACPGEVLDVLRSGADDCFVGDVSYVELVAKIESCMTRRDSAVALGQYYRELRRQHSETLAVIRATADLMESLDREYRTNPMSGETGGDSLFEEKLEIGLGMIRSLASILQQQTDSLTVSDLVDKMGSRHSPENYPLYRFEPAQATMALLQ